MSQFDWPITQKKRNYGDLKIEGPFLKYRIPPLLPTYVGERRTTVVEAYGIEVRWYGDNVGEHIGNLGNLLRT
jgi:hypothetical protein